MTAQTTRRRVLFVEDEGDLRKMYQRFFRARYDLAFAGTGEEALTQVTAFKPEVVVLDMRLPDTDGIELLRRIRGTDPELPVIITTAYLSMEPLVQVLGMPHSGYLVKPFELAELGERIDAVS